MLKRVIAGVLDVAYEEAGAPDGAPVVLLHGFPYDVHAFDEATPLLTARGCRVIAPYLRGYGPTRFLAAATPRSGQQAVLGHDLLALMDALAVPRAVLAGYDWGGRAACIVAALWPERTQGLVSCGGYNIQDIAGAAKPAGPRAGASLLVSVLLSRRARPRRPREASPGAGEAPLAALVTRTGASMTRPSSGPRSPSTTPTSSRS